MARRDLKRRGKGFGFGVGLVPMDLLEAVQLEYWATVTRLHNEEEIYMHREEALTSGCAQWGFLPQVSITRVQAIIDER